ncbi:MAG: hypothetical protein ACJ8J0_15340, partial [Longimicrobiaceae bacterium]
CIDIARHFRTMYHGDTSSAPVTVLPGEPAMSDTPTTGEIASKVTTQTGGLTEVITGASEAAGTAEEVASIEKFKLHKDNPTQIPLGRDK